MANCAKGSSACIGFRRHVQRLWPAKNWGFVNSNRRYGCIVFELLAEQIYLENSEKKMEKGVLQRLCMASAPNTRKWIANWVVAYIIRYNSTNRLANIWVEIAILCCMISRLVINLWTSNGSKMATLILKFKGAWAFFEWKLTFFDKMIHER